MAVERIKVAGIPVDVCREEDMEGAVLELLAAASQDATETARYVGDAACSPDSGGTAIRRIMFLTIWDLLKARHNKEMRAAIESASLILPVSKSIIKGASFLKKSVPKRWNPFDAIIQIMSTVEMRRRSLYLLGARPMTLGKAEANVRATFPAINIVGRYAGYYSKKAEGDVIEAINKSAPSLVLLSEGLKDRALWAYRRREVLKGGAFLYYNDAFGIFSDRIRRVKKKTFDKGHEVYIEVFRSPFKVFLIFPFMWYKVVLLFYRLFRKDS